MHCLGASALWPTATPTRCAPCKALLRDRRCPCCRSFMLRSVFWCCRICMLGPICDRKLYAGVCKLHCLGVSALADADIDRVCAPCRYESLCCRHARAVHALRVARIVLGCAFVHCSLGHSQTFDVSNVLTNAAEHALVIICRATCRSVPKQRQAMVACARRVADGNSHSLGCCSYHEPAHRLALRMTLTHDTNS